MQVERWPCGEHRVSQCGRCTQPSGKRSGDGLSRMALAKASQERRDPILAEQMLRKRVDDRAPRSVRTRPRGYCSKVPFPVAGQIHQRFEAQMLPVRPRRLQEPRRAYARLMARSV